MTANRSPIVTAGITTLIIGLVIVLGWHGYLWMDAKTLQGQEAAKIQQGADSRKTGLGLVDSLGSHLAEQEKARLQERTDARIAEVRKSLIKWLLIVGGVGVGLIIVGRSTTSTNKSS